MKYCRRCMIPDTRPNIRLNEHDICNACLFHELKSAIDWESRKKMFEIVAADAKKRSQGYDCVIPVSGGKDSTWQVLQCLRFGLRPLAVTWKSPARTEIGQKNLDNLIAFGVDHIDYQINPETERKFMLKAFQRFGSTAIPMHMAIFNIPVKIAVSMKIPLIVWGENSAMEYGGEAADYGFNLDAAWLKKYGITHGTTAEDWVDSDLSRAELTAYFGPSPEDLMQQQISAIFLGAYFPWDPQKTYEMAKQNGFQAREEGPKTGFYDFADIDDDFISIHHFMKWYKFGFTRTFDNLSLEIRHGRLSRAQALDILKERGDETPWRDIERFCLFSAISVDQFFNIAEKFRNKQIWQRLEEKWKIPGFLIPDWRWAEDRVSKLESQTR